MAMADNGGSGTSITKSVAVGAASAGAGGTFSFFLFHEMDVPALLRDHTVYSLAVFALVALVVLITGYLVLPRSAMAARHDRVLSYLMMFFGAIVSVGLLEAAYNELVSPPQKPIPITIRFKPNLASMTGLDVTLDAELDDGNIPRTFTNEPAQSNVMQNQRLTITVEHLDVLVQKYREALAFYDRCKKLELQGSSCYAKAVIE
jgi:hypothetical protein